MCLYTLCMQVHLVRWMPGGDRLASYDSWGRIIVWRNRANIFATEFQVNTPVNVTDMQWSCCGYYIVICGKEGHIQMISGINGLSFFSIQVEAISPLSARATFNCSAWNEPGTRVAFGTQSGEVVLLDPSDNGSSLSTTTIKKNVAVRSIQWYGPVVNCETRSGKYKSQGLSAYLRNGDVIFFKTMSDPHCVYSQAGVYDGLAAWNSSYTLLALVGYAKDLSCPLIRFLNTEGHVIFSIHNALSQLSSKQVCPSNLLVNSPQ